jgi:vacuolar-type H+-ATPase subunit H
VNDNKTLTFVAEKERQNIYDESIKEFRAKALKPKSPIRNQVETPIQSTPQNNKIVDEEM